MTLFNEHGVEGVSPLATEVSRSTVRCSLRFSQSVSSSVSPDDQQLGSAMAAFSTSSSRPYHIVIFGASGFTGQFVVEEVARTASEGPKGNLKWAVAGRNRTKLEKVVEQAAGALSKPELKSEVDILIADVGDPDSLAAMCKQAVIVLSCVGPFLESMQLNYHDQAAEKGVYIVGSCGFDSIPADIGVIYTRDQFKGTLTSIESFLTASAGPEGGCIHDGTWQSAIYGLADSDKLRSLRKKFGHKPLPVVGTKIKRRGTLFYSNELQQYAIPFMGSDPSVVKRTQRYLNEELNESPVQYGAYVGVGGISNIFKLVFAGLMFFFLVKFSFGRNLLMKVKHNISCCESNILHLISCLHCSL
ncbi:hypothetical protein cypCar_00024720 [Cyprinus carpio]|nr:hypothetical protein cypCar_00024720 [Cyprinus carpio]